MKNLFNKKTVFISLISLVLVCAIVLVCALTQTQVNAEELSAGYKRKATDTEKISDDFKLAAAEFSMKLFGNTVKNDKEKDNALVSPLSAALCLAMLTNGADGETREQLEALFGMDIEALNIQLYSYTKSLYNAEDCKVNIADSIWFKNEDTLYINEDFLQTNADWYDAQIYSAPFDGTTLDDINKWCKRHTDGMIEKILDGIDRDSIMYLINALTFDAKWANKYESRDVSEKAFVNYDGSSSKVEMLSSYENTYICANGAEGFVKNYMGDKYSFVGLLPDSNIDIYNYIASLDGKGWMELWNSREYTSVEVKIPEFKYDREMNMNDTLKSLGVTDMFDSNSADFSKLGHSDEGNIYCKRVVQKTYIEVDRNGTKAAAITFAEMEKATAMLGKNVTLDRPFVFAIVDNATGLPLFIGAVTAL